MPRYDSNRGRLTFQSGERFSRRLLLELAAGGVGGAALSAFLAACGSSSSSSSSTSSASSSAASSSGTTSTTASSTSSAASGAVSSSPTAGGTPGASSAQPVGNTASSSWQTPSNGTPKTGGTLNIGYATEPTSLDPQYDDSSSDGNLIGFLYDTLLTQDPRTGQYIVGPLCESFDISTDQLTWTFHLKKNIVFHDGTPLTAQSIQQDYKHAADPKSATYVTGIYLPPNGKYGAPDDYTFTIQSPQPYGPMESHIGWTAWFGVYPPAERTKLGQNFGHHPVGSGPFQFTDWAAGDHLVFSRYPKYTWGKSYLTHKGPAYLDQLYFKFITQPNTMVSALKSGDIDLAFLPNQFYSQFSSDSNFHILERPSGTLIALGWNMQHWPFTDLATRQALAYGFDRQRFLTVLEAGHGQIMEGSIVPALPDYWAGAQSSGPQYDPAKAKSMLAAAGWKSGSGGILEKDGKEFKVTLINGGTPTDVQFSSLVQAQAKDLGISVSIKTLEQATLTAQLNAGDYDLFEFGYATDDPDILGFFFDSANIPSKTSAGINWSRVSDPKLDQMINQQRHSLGPARATAVANLERYMIEQAIFLPLFSPSTYTVVNKKVQGVIFGANSMDWDLTDAWLSS